MIKKIIRVVVIVVTIVILGWIMAYLISPTLQRKYDARSYGKFLYKEEEEQLKKNYPVDKIKYSWSLWVNPHEKDNDAWGAYPPDNSFICSIHIYKLKRKILNNFSDFNSKKNYYSSSVYNNLNNRGAKFGSQWYSLSQFNINYFEKYLGTSYGTPTLDDDLKECVYNFFQKNINSELIRNSIEAENNVFKLDFNHFFGYLGGYEKIDYPFFSFIENSSDYFSILFNPDVKVRFDGNCGINSIIRVSKNNLNTTKFYIYDEKSLTLSVIQVRNILNLKVCQP
ncbi:hypothetical protein M5F04_07120 [Acinetobacter sp. ANC 7200]|uniref:hypothetical protein n=1 Tax=Acinetobacter amyesii TaxID=2942470 RepID=UPI0020C0392C|nr:hypothetical protein [Acinetobacter amyesii]MCL6244339.1 hypothetical protein [Acinetobacter amyesii]